jgi:hypothetical protein
MQMLMLPLGYLHGASVHALLGHEPLLESAGDAADVEHERPLRHEAHDHDEIGTRAMLREVWNQGGSWSRSPRKTRRLPAAGSS